MVDYYDRIIVGIAGSVFGGMLLGAVTALGIYTGVFLGALVATAFVYDAMFSAPAAADHISSGPRPRQSSGTRSCSSSQSPSTSGRRVAWTYTATRTR